MLISPLSRACSYNNRLNASWIFISLEFRRLLVAFCDWHVASASAGLHWPTATRYWSSAPILPQSRATEAASTKCSELWCTRWGNRISPRRESFTISCFAQLICLALSALFLLVAHRSTIRLSTSIFSTYHSSYYSPSSNSQTHMGRAASGSLLTTLQSESGNLLQKRHDEMLWRPQCLLRQHQ